MISKEDLVSLAKQVDSECPIDWGMMQVDENIVYDIIASQVLEIYSETTNENREAVLLASLVHILIENFKLNFRSECSDGRID